MKIGEIRIVVTRGRIALGLFLAMIVALAVVTLIGQVRTSNAACSLKDVTKQFIGADANARARSAERAFRNETLLRKAVESTQKLVDLLDQAKTRPGQDAAGLEVFRRHEVDLIEVLSSQRQLNSNGAIDQQDVADYYKSLVGLLYC